MAKWISILKQELKKPLPGPDTQLRMAPSRLRSPQKPIPMRDSGVLLLLYPVKNKMHTVFMKRPEYGGPHSGQISFPGGKSELADESLVETAIRESREEVGIPVNELNVIGTLSPLYIPISNFKVLPVVGYLNRRPEFIPDKQEVEYLIESSLDDLLDPSICKTKTLSFDDLSVEIPYFDVKGHHIWGATAMILSEFLEIVRRMQ